MIPQLGHHVKNMLQNAVWGTEAELFAAALWLRTDIYVFKETKWERFSHLGSLQDPAKYPAIYIRNLKKHFELVVKA